MSQKPRSDDDDILAPAARQCVNTKTYVAGEPALRPVGRIPSVVEKAGRRAYQVEYRGGEVHPKGTNAGGTFTVPAFLPADQLRVAFRVWYPRDFPWGAGMERVGGKIFGFKIGDGEASGGRYSTTGATYRMTWNRNGGVGPYLYPQLRRARGKNEDSPLTWAELDQSKDVQEVGDITAGVHLWYPEPRDRENPAKWDLKLTTEAWNRVEMYCKLNTPGKRDGVLEITVNGVTKRLDTVRYRYDNAQITGLMLSTFFGGGTKEYAPPRDTKAWYADFKVSAA